MKYSKVSISLALLWGLPFAVSADVLEARTFSSVTTSQIQVASGRMETGTVTGSQEFTSGDKISIRVC